MPRVAAPLRWEEVERAAETGDAQGLRIGVEEALGRLPWAGELAPVGAR